MCTAIVLPSCPPRGISSGSSSKINPLRIHYETFTMHFGRCCRSIDHKGEATWQDARTPCSPAPSSEYLPSSSRRLLGSLRHRGAREQVYLPCVLLCVRGRLPPSTGQRAIAGAWLGLRLALGRRRHRRALGELRPTEWHSIMLFGKSRSGPPSSSSSLLPLHPRRYDEQCSSSLFV